MIFAREYIRSRFHGLGQVIESGADPVVQFLDGRECEVPGETLTIVREEGLGLATGAACPHLPRVGVPQDWTR